MYSAAALKLIIAVHWKQQIPVTEKQDGMQMDQMSQTLSQILCLCC
jgi:hypothetical protein